MCHLNGWEGGESTGVLLAELQSAEQLGQSHSLCLKVDYKKASASEVGKDVSFLCNTSYLALKQTP